MATDQMKLDRRKLLQGISLATTASIAGCGGQGGTGDDGGDNGGELGERVPNVIYEYWPESGGATEASEAFLEVIEPNLDALGINVETQPQTASAAIGEGISDERDHNFMIYNHGATPDRLDPDEFVIRYAADEAGGVGTNLQQYANCEQTDPAHLQRGATTLDERQQYVNEAILRQSEDWVAAPLFPFVNFGAVRTDLVEMGDSVGEMGISRESYWSHIDADPYGTDDNAIKVNTPNLESSSHFDPGATGMLTKWSQLLYSTLTTYSGDFELQNSLAENVDISDDAQEITIELKEGATFHNGREITADDVKFTFEFINANVDQNLYQSELPLERIDVVDDLTANFVTNEALLSLITKTFPKWGILPREQWEDVEQLDEFEPHETDEGLIGSGPFQLEDFEAGNFARMVPYEDHILHDVDHNLIFQLFNNRQPVYQSMLSGELNQAVSLGRNFAEQLREEDNVEVFVNLPHTTFIVYPQCQRPPSLLPEFRHAVGTAYDRRMMNDLAFGGLAEPLLYSGNSLSPNHPSFNPDQHVNYTDKEEGDIEAARQILEDAGFGWDDQDRLHYPLDADLNPQWPKGTTPGAHAPDEFPCLNEDNEWVHPDDR